MLMRCEKFTVMMIWDGNNIEELKKFLCDYKDASITPNSLGGYSLSICGEYIKIGNYLANEYDGSIKQYTKEEVEKRWRVVKSTELALKEDYNGKNQTTKIRENIKKVFSSDIKKGAKRISITYICEEDMCESSIF